MARMMRCLSCMVTDCQSLRCLCLYSMRSVGEMERLFERGQMAKEEERRRKFQRESGWGEELFKMS